MKSTIFAGLVAVAVAQDPTITSNSRDVLLTSPYGDIKIITPSGGCTASAPCALGATISSMQDSISSMADAMYTSTSTLTSAQTSMNASLNNLAATAAIASDVESTYVTMSGAASMYVPLTAMSNYATMTQLENAAEAQRDYTDQLVEELANATNVTTDIINSHCNLGVLNCDNGTHSGDIVVNGATDLITIQSLLDHVVEVRGNIIISNVRSSITDLSSGLFSNLVTVGGNIVVQNSPSFTTLGSGFPRLTTVGGQLKFLNNANLASLGTSFAQVRSIGGGLTISGSPSLSTTVPQGVFANLNSIAGSSLQGAFQPSMIYIGDLAGSADSINTALGSAQITTGAVSITASGTSFPSTLNNLRSIGGRLALQGTSLQTMQGVFPNLGALGGDLYIYGNNALVSFGNGFQRLQVVAGTLTISYHRRALTTMAGAFPALTNVTGNLYMQFNDYLNDMSGAFPQLRWVNGLMYFYYQYRLGSFGSNTFPVLEYAGGVRFYRSFYYTVNGQGATLNGAFPQLARVGTNGVYFYYCLQLIQMNNAFPLLVRCDGFLYHYYLQGLTDISSTYTRLQYVGNYVYLYNLQGLTTMSNFLPQLQTVQGTIFYIIYNSRLRTITGSFNNVQSLRGSLYIYNNYAMTSFTNNFQRLTGVGQNFYMYNNRALASVSGSFTSLSSIGSNFYFYYNYALTSIGNAFNQLQSCSTLRFFGNGGSSRWSSTSVAAMLQFCNSAAPVFCRTTTTYSNAGWPHDTDNCCNAYCTANPSNC